MKAAVPCDDRQPRRTPECTELGPKAKEWGTERLWSGLESRACTGTLFNRELSTPGFFQILCLEPLLCSSWSLFHSGLKESACVWHV